MQAVSGALRGILLRGILLRGILLRGILLRGIALPNRLPDATLDCLWYTYSFSVVLRYLCLDIALSWIGAGTFLARSLPSLWLRRHLARMGTTAQWLGVDVEQTKERRDKNAVQMQEVLCQSRARCPL